jgi:4-hydroxy-4-methyl-2-oxoglutarate aldolase
VLEKANAMIDDPPLLDILRHHTLPARASVDRFRNLPTSFVVDAMGGRGALDWRIKPVGPVLPMLGVALTCHCGPGDNLALCAAIAQCEHGDILVAATDGFAGCAVVGDLLLGIAKNREAAGFVTDGLIRDQNDIEALAFPCFAAGATPNSPARCGPGSVGLPVQCGGLRIETGDLIIGDRDGVVVVPQAQIAAVLDRLPVVQAAEAKMLASVKAGLSEVGFVAALLASDRVRYLDDDHTAASAQGAT